jgi:signal transduction histidine kinase
VASAPVTAGGALALDLPDDELDIGIGDDILLVDDSNANLVAIEAALNPLGRRLVTARSGVEALARLLEMDFALILLDVAMPGMSGIETARLVRSRQRSRGTPIIFITGMAWHDDAIDAAYEAGGFDFLTKPIRPELLRAKANVFLRLQERTRALREHATRLHESQARLHAHELEAQRKRFDSELLDSKLQQLAEFDRSRDEIVAMLGHELRNPLQTLQMAFDILRQYPAVPKSERIHEVIDWHFTRVTRLLDGLLDVARFSTGQFELRRDPVDLEDITLQAVEDCRPLVVERRHAIRVEKRCPASLIAIGDQVRLVQAIASLVDNAARYTPAGGRIDITLDASGGDIVIAVADNGRGIASELLPRIFDMFVRDRATSDGSGGLGLGLGLVKRVVELHDGSIRAGSNGPGAGSVFEVRIPFAPQELDIGSLEIKKTPTGGMAPLDR